MWLLTFNQYKDDELHVSFPDALFSLTKNTGLMSCDLIRQKKQLQLIPIFYLNTCLPTL